MRRFLLAVAVLVILAAGFIGAQSQNFPGVSGSTAPLVVSGNTVSCPTCATTTNGGALSGTNGIAVSSAGVISNLAFKFFSYSAANGGATTVTNTVEGAPVVISEPVSFTKIYYDINALDASDLYDIGIYSCPSNDCSANGVTATLVCDTGAIAQTATGAFATTCTQGGTIVIQPGTYVLAYTGNSNVAKFADNLNSIIPWSTGGMGASSGGVLPGTVTTPTTGTVLSTAATITFALH